MKKLTGFVLLLLCVASVHVLIAQEPAWNPANVKPCDRACLVAFMERYMNAIYKKDMKLLPPLAKDYTQPYGLGDGWTAGSGR